MFRFKACLLIGCAALLFGAGCSSVSRSPTSTSSTAPGPELVTFEFQAPTSTLPWDSIAPGHGQQMTFGRIDISQDALQSSAVFVKEEQWFNQDAALKAAREDHFGDCDKNPNCLDEPFYIRETLSARWITFTGNEEIYLNHLSPTGTLEPQKEKLTAAQFLEWLKQQPVGGQPHLFFFVFDDGKLVRMVEQYLP